MGPDKPRYGLALPIAVVVLTLAAGGIGGVWAALFMLAFGFAVLTAFHLFHLFRLQRWAVSSLEHYTPPPEGAGVWGDVLAALSRREQKRVAFQAAQKRIIDQFRRIGEALPDGVVVLDGERRIEWANDRAQRWLALDLKKDLGQPIGNLVRYPDFLKFLGGDFRLDSDAAPRALLIPSALDAGRVLALQQAPFGGDGLLLLVRDVTHREAAARMRREFIASVSHELKTPLTVIVGFLETLQDTDSDAETRSRYLELMQQQARSMQRLVDDLLTLSALESGERAKEETWFGIVPLLKELQSETQALSQGKHAVVLTLPENAALEAQVHGVRDELASAFTNLLSNAVRYTPEGGTITLSWTVDHEGRGIFSVRDSGIGIAAEHLPRLTERFYRVDRGRSRASGGTGLGLAIVKHVLLRHQGELSIESRVGEGSIFSAVLPESRVRCAGALAQGDGRT